MSRIPDVLLRTTSDGSSARQDVFSQHTQIIGIRTPNVNATAEDSLGESGYESILSSTFDITLTDRRPAHTSTPLTFLGPPSTSVNSPATPVRPSHVYSARALFHEDLLTSIHQHQPELLQKILDYLQPKDLHNLVRAGLKWKPYVRQHPESWRRLSTYQDELAARRENIPTNPLTAVHHDGLDTARASFTERLALRSLQNIHIVEQRASSSTITIERPEPPRVPRPLPVESVRRPASTSAANNKEKMRRLRRLLK